MPKHTKNGWLDQIVTNITSGTLKLSKPTLRKWKEAKVGFKIGRNLLLQGMGSGIGQLCHANVLHVRCEPRSGQPS